MGQTMSIGPQRGAPASSARLKAQERSKQINGTTTCHSDDGTPYVVNTGKSDRFCPHCNYECMLATDGKTWLCTKCWRTHVGA